MPREFYSIPASADIMTVVRELNRILDSISRRLNYLYAEGEDTAIDGKNITGLESGSADDDAVRKDQIGVISSTFIASRLVATDASTLLTTVANLAAWIAGTADEITVTNDGDGSVTLSLPNAIKLDGATASRLLATDGSKKTASADLASWIAGTSNEVTVTDDGDGSVTIEGAGDDTDFTVLSAIQAGGGGALGIQYKTRALTLNGGIITTVGAESGWNDI